MIPARVVLPAEGADHALVVSMSGGKDSTAVALALREADLPFRMVFADTGWEAKEHYGHLDLLREKLGPIDVVVAEPPPARDDVETAEGERSAMVERIRYRAGFPARLQRWCTRELKLKPLRAYHDALGVETVSVVGVRADESKARASAKTWEDDLTWGGFLWRPILTWTVEDVIAIHHRHGVPMHQLYVRGHNRVGCYPCIFAGKEEIRLVAEHAPDRIEQIASLEREMVQLRRSRNDVTPGRYAYPDEASFFQTRKSGPPKPMSIAEVVAWSRTSYGGKSSPLMPPPPDGGCFRWGLCEPPQADDAEAPSTRGAA